MDLAQVRQGFVSAGIPTPIIDEIPAAYEEAKRRYHLGDHRPQEVEGGRFAEAVFRALQHVAGQPVTPIGKTLPPSTRCSRRSKTPQASTTPCVCRFRAP